MSVGYAALERQAAAIARDFRALRQDREAAGRSLKAATDIAAAMGVVLDPWQVEIVAPPLRDTLVMVTRQGGKGTAATVLALATMLGDPGSKVLVISRTERQAKRLFRRITNAYAKLPNVPATVTETTTRLELRNGSIAIALPGTEATIRGEDAVDLAIMDEASRVPDDLFRTVMPMLATTNGVAIGLTTPYGKRGWFFDEWTGDNDWRRVKIPAEQISRISAAFLEKERKRIGEWWFEQEYNCRFMDNQWQVFATDMVLAAASDDVLPLFAQTAIADEADEGASDTLSQLFGVNNE